MTTPIEKNYTLIELDNFDLSKISDTFGYATFERKVTMASVNKILEAIISGKMHNHTILGTQIEEGKYSIFDGQHRLEALKLAYKDYGVMNFNLVLHVFDKKLEREAYVNSNSGKALSLRDFTKAIDDGTIPYFNESRGLLNHYATKTNFSFGDVLMALMYVRKGNLQNTISYRAHVKEIFLSITTEESTAIRNALEAVMASGVTLRSTHLSKASLFRNMVRLAYEYPELVADYMGIGIKLEKNEKVRGILLNMSGSLKAIGLIWVVLNSEILPQYLH